MRRNRTRNPKIPNDFVATAGTGATYQRTTTMPKRVVHPLDRTRTTVELLAQAMLPRTEEIGVSPVSIRVNQALLPRRRNPRPQMRQTTPAPISDIPGDNLARIPGNRRPKPLIPLFADAEFIQLQSILWQKYQCLRGVDCRIDCGISRDAPSVWSPIWLVFRGRRGWRGGGV
jgi:hypothetical protein